MQLIISFSENERSSILSAIPQNYISSIPAQIPEQIYFLKSIQNMHDSWTIYLAIPATTPKFQKYFQSTKNDTQSIFWWNLFF